MKRRLEFVGGNSAKFYEVETAGNEVTVCYGRIGSEGQTQTKSFGEPAKAQQHAASLIQQKLGKGYVEQAASR